MFTNAKWITLKVNSTKYLWIAFMTIWMTSLELFHWKEYRMVYTLANSFRVTCQNLVINIKEIYVSVIN